METVVLVASHKIADVPNDEMYLPIQVGSQEKLPIGFVRDCTGDNISLKNKNYSELTALYWGWKNLNTDYLGLVHYRRFFKGKNGNILSKKEIQKIWESGYDMVLPSKRHYVITTLEKHYACTHHSEELNHVKRVIQENFQDCIGAYERVMKRRSAHMFNMCIMKKELLDEYCSWLFSILEELENRLDLTGYTPFEARVCGRISELLLDVWLEKQKENGRKISYKEIPVLYTEPVRWNRKIINFLNALLFKKKYTQSV